MKTKKENILVLVTAGKESKRFMELAKDAAKAGNGDLYILHVAQGENILESGEMYEMQRLADYGCRLGGQVCLCCEPLKCFPGLRSDVPVLDQGGSLHVSHRGSVAAQK